MNKYSLDEICCCDDNSFTVLFFSSFLVGHLYLFVHMQKTNMISKLQILGSSAAGDDLDWQNLLSIKDLYFWDRIAFVWSMKGSQIWETIILKALWHSVAITLGSDTALSHYLHVCMFPLLSWSCCRNGVLAEYSNVITLCIYALSGFVHCQVCLGMPIGCPRTVYRSHKTHCTTVGRP